MSEEQEDAAPAETEKKCSQELDAKVKKYLRDEGVDSCLKELNAKVKKSLRGEGVDLEVLKDKKLKGQFAVREELYGKSASAAAKAEKVQPYSKKEKPTKQERASEMVAAIADMKDVPVKKTKGRNKLSKVAKKKQDEISRAKRPFLDQQMKEEEVISKKKQKLSEEVELPKSLHRFAWKSAS